MVPDDYYIGIDLGTANTCVAVFRNEKAEIIPHEGQSQMPSYVAFTETGRLVGSAAKNQAGINPENTIFNALRFIGRRHSDPEVQAMVRSLPFRVIESRHKPVFLVQYRGVGVVLTPEEILSMILSRAKKDAHSYLGGKYHVRGAVITVPAYFNVCQRQAIKDAASIAELPALRLINAPTTACSDYAITHRPCPEGTDGKNVLITDAGAGTFNVLLAIIGGGVLEVKSVASDLGVGGEDFDTRLLNYLVNKFKLTTNLDLTVNPRALRRLRTACENAKCELSSQEQTQIEIEQLYEGHDLVCTITRTKFEELCLDLFRCLREPIERVLRDAKMEKSAIHSAILIGGSSRIPKIQKMLSQFLEGKEFSKCLNLDETAARGAAIYAAILTGKVSELSLVIDVAPFSLGIETAGGIMTPLVKRNTLIPTIETQVFSTFEDNQKSFLVSAYEGDRARTKDNLPLGKLELPLPLAPRGVPQIEVTIDIDADSCITLSAEDKGSKQKKRVILADFDRLPKEELDCMIVEARKFDAVDEAEEERIEARNAAGDYVFALKHSISSQPRTGTVIRIERLADILLNWLDENQSAPASEYRIRLSGLEKVARSIAEESSESDTTKVKNVIREEAPPSPPKSAPESARSFSEARTSDVASPSRAESETAKPDAPHHSSAFGRNPHTSSAAKPDYESPLHSTARKNLAESRQETLNQHGRSEPHALAPDPRTASPSISEPATSDISDRSHTLPSDTPRSAERGMAELFSKPIEGRPTYTDADFIRISTYLRNAGCQSWSNVPRLYTVLRLIDQLDMLDTFVEQGIMDIWFPFAQTSLPNALSPSARANFLTSQEAVLSKSLLFEKNPDRKHAHFSRDEPLPFQVIAKLGSGAHGHVDKVMSTVSHREYARKLFRKARGVSKNAIQSFLIELQVLKRVQHFHCVELVQSYTDPKYFAIIMSPVGDCNLFDYYDIARNSPDKLSLLRSFFGCLANALQYIHSIKIRHRDIKPHNVLVRGDRVFLTDFGIALDWENLSRSTTTADSGKTWLYAAPEVARYEKRNSAADVWSLGCVFMEMITVLKGQSVTTMRDFFEERSGNYRFYANIARLLEWVDKLQKLGSAKDDAVFKWAVPMLQEHAEDRPTAATLYHDISAECASGHVPFCGSCCLEAVESSEFEDEDEDELWGRAAELTLAPEKA